MAYNESSIQHHKGLSGVRTRPGMYLGERGNHMVRTLVKELVDNSLDEFLAGRNKELEVWADPKSNTYIVADSAEGIPVGIHPKAKISTLTLIFTELHAGGKFDDKAYSSSAGTHGVGSSAVNAVCQKFEVWTFRDRNWHHQAFSEGIPLFQVKKSPPPTSVTSKLTTCGKRGTIIRITPDQSIVSIDKGKTPARLELNSTATWLKNLSLLNKGLTVTFSANGKTRSFINNEGIVKVVKNLVETRELEVMGKPLVYEDHKLQYALQWTSYTEDDGLQSYVSCSSTRDGGTHVDEFLDALVKALAPYRNARDKYSPRDVRNGMIGALNWNMSGPEFSSQVKDRLTSNLNKGLFQLAFSELTRAFSQNQALARKIIKRASEAKKAKEDFKKVMDGIGKVNAAKRGMILPNILATARRCKPEQRELFVVEGESASGCFSADTLVLLSDGTHIRFDEMQRLALQGVVFKGIGFDLTTQRFEEFEFDEPRVTKYVDELIEVELSDGTVWRCTPDHPWLLGDGKTYMGAEDLTEGMSLKVQHQHLS